MGMKTNKSLQFHAQQRSITESLFEREDYEEDVRLNSFPLTSLPCFPSLFFFFFVVVVFLLSFFKLCYDLPYNEVVIRRGSLLAMFDYVFLDRVTS